MSSANFASPAKSILQIHFRFVGYAFPPDAVGAYMSFQLRLSGAGIWVVVRDGKQIGTLECAAQHAVQLLIRKDEGLSAEEKAELDKLILGIQYRQG